MFDVVFSLLIVLIYYLVFVRPHVDLTNIVGPPDSHYDPTFSPPNIPWLQYLDLSRYQLLQSGVIQEVGPCTGQADGAFVHADGASIHRFNRRLHSFYKPNALPDDDSATPVYYFECQNQTEADLYYCPPGTTLEADKQRCVALHICDLKPDGYTYPANNDPTAYYECRGKLPVLQSCPPGQIYHYTQCRPPKDPCQLQPDDHVLSFDRHTYEVCQGGVTRKKRCPVEEYFDGNQCLSEICEYNPNGNVALPEKPVQYWKYVSDYAVCEDGKLSQITTCPSRDGGVTEPPTQVFDPATETCVEPELCRNVQPAGTAFPDVKHRTQMGNYDYSHLLDHLRGFVCTGTTLTATTLPPGQKISPSGEYVSVCDNLPDEKVPVMDRFDSYYDCAVNAVVQCPAGLNAFDYGAQKCFAADDTYHKFEDKMPVFQFSGLSDENWFDHRNRPVRTTNKTCQAPLVHDATYDVCVDPQCRKMGFLSQLGQGRKIYMNDDHACIVTPNHHIEYLPYSKPANLHLDYWIQKFVEKPTQHCSKTNFFMQSPDFVMNAAVFPTCDSEHDKIHFPFILCPSTYTRTRSGTPALCYPKISLTTRTLKGNEAHAVYAKEVKEIKCSNDGVDKLIVNGVHNYTCAGGKFDIDYSIFTVMSVHPSADVTLVKAALLTNFPTYYINEHNHRALHAYDFQNNLNLNVKTATYQMESYTIGKGLKGFH